MKNESVQNEIKQANRKAMPKFIAMVVAGMLLGAVIGFLALELGIEALSDKLQIVLSFFGMNIAPWLLLAVAVLLPCICIPLYLKSKKILASWDGEDETVSDAAETKISYVIWMTGSALILSYFLIAASYSGGFSIAEKAINAIGFFVAITAFIAVMLEVSLIQQRCVDTVKMINPEKKGSVYDSRFYEKWLDSCDEAEQIMIGKCAMKAFRTTSTVCSVLSVVLVLGALFLGIGFLPALTVAIIWLAEQTAYYREGIKLSKAGNKLS